MKVTSVELKLWKQETVLASASIVLDGAFAVHEIRIVKKNGKIVIAMPNRKTTVKCDCGERNAFDSIYCSRCGGKRNGSKPSGKLFTDLAHPINAALRKEIEAAVLDAYECRK
jgi:DNA-binding cell septation regulator SpoVG